MAVNLRADLQRFTGPIQAGRQRVQYAARVTKPVYAFAVHQVRVNASDLGSDIRTHAQRAARQLVNQLERTQIEVVAGSSQQRLDIFEQRRQNELIAMQREEVEHASTQRFHTARGLGQNVLYIFRQQPFTHGGSTRYGIRQQQKEQRARIHAYAPISQAARVRWRRLARQ
jgi:hypothetical protein